MANLYVRTGGTGGGTSFEDGYTTIGAAIAAATSADTVFVASDHTETFTVDTTWTCPTTPGLRIIALDTNTGSPTSGQSERTAIVTTTTNAADLVINGHVYIYGIEFDIGTGTAQCTMALGNSNSVNHMIVLDQCGLDFQGGSGSYVSLGAPGTNVNIRCRIVIRNCEIYCEGNGTFFRVRQGDHHIQGLTVRSGGTTTIAFFDINGSGSIGHNLLAENLDLTHLNSGCYLFSVTSVASARLLVRNSKLPASFAGMLNVTTGIGEGIHLIAHNVANSDTQHDLYHRQYAGTLVEETTLIRTNGGATSVRFDDTTNSKFPNHTLMCEGTIYNSSTGSAKTLTVPILHDSVTNLQNDEIWVEVIHQGTASYPLGVTNIDDRMAEVTSSPADQDADSGSTWTTTGMTNPNKQKLTCTFTPQEAGYVTFRVHMAGGATKTVYVDMLGATLA